MEGIPLSDMTILMSSVKKALELGLTKDEDVRLIESFLAGNQAAFDEIVVKYRSYVYNIALRIVGNPTDAEDAAQNVFVSLYKALPRFRMQSKMSTYIYRIATNECIGHKRRQRGELPIESDVGVRSPQLDGPDRRWEVTQLLQGLAPHYRVVLTLKYYRELSCEEIAEILGWSTKKVKNYLHRARNLFRQAYERADSLDGGAL